MTRNKTHNVVSGWNNQYIDILGADNIPNEYGGSDPNTSPYWSTYAKVKSVRTYRTNSAGVSELIMAYEFVVRYRNDKNLQNNMVLKWRGCFFTIFDYNPDVVYQDFVTFRAIQTNPGNLVVQPTT